MANHTQARRRLVGALAAISLTTPAVLSACANPEAEAEQAADTDCGKELKLGILTAFTGELGSFGISSRNAFDLAIDEMESSGQLPAGWSVPTVVMDEETNIQIGLRAATDMMQNRKVSAILGPSSGPIVAMDTISRRYKTPILSQFAGTMNFSSVGGDYIFRTVASDASDGKAVAQNLAEREATDVAVVVQNDQSTLTAGRTVADSLKDEGGKVTRTITYNPGQSAYLSVVQQAIAELDGGADAVYIAGGQESATTILRELRDRGVSSDKIIVSADLVVPEVVQGVGKKWADGLTGVTPSVDTERPQYERLAKSYEAEYGEAPPIFVENAYDAVVLVALAAVSAESTCGSSIAKALPEVAGDGNTTVNTFAEGAKALAKGETINYEGASGPVDFDKTGTVPGSYAVYTVTDGDWEPTKFYDAETLEDE